MVKHMITLTSDAVAREFPPANREIACSNLLDSGNKSEQGDANLAQHIPMNLIDHSQVLAAGISQHHRIHQATWTSHDCGAAARPPKHWHVGRAASRQIDLLR